MNGYELSRNWFNWCFDNPEKIKPNHTALYFYAIEHCNRLGWKEKFGLPTSMAKEAIGIRSYNTYINTLNELVDWGFLTMVEKSKNQHSSNIVALSKFDKANNTALDKALINQEESTSESISTIVKPQTKKPRTIKNISQNKLVNWLLENAPRVMRMKEPLTDPQAEKLIEDYARDLIIEVFSAMDNHEPLLQKNRSANKTFRNWAKRSGGQKTNSEPTNRKRQWD